MALLIPTPESFVEIHLKDLPEDPQTIINVLGELMPMQGGEFTCNQGRDRHMRGQPPATLPARASPGAALF